MEVDTSIYGRVSIPIMADAIADLCALQTKLPGLKVMVRRGPLRFMIPLKAFILGDCEATEYDFGKLGRLAFG